MRSVKSSLIAFGVSAFVGAAAVFGCSASGGGDDVTDQAPTDPGQGNNSASLPPPSNPPTGDDPPTATDAGKKDSGSTDAGKDSGPPPPSPGDACTKVDSTVSKPCGACGTQQAICQGDADAGTLKWSQYGVCQGELAGGCTPGATEACGNCGTHTCSKYCAWDSCKEPPGACKPGSKDYSSAGCTAPNTYRNRDCGNACTWSSFSTTCGAPVNANTLQIATSVNGMISGNYTFSASNVGDRLDSFATSCPGTASTGTYPYVAVEVQNKTAKKATISLQSAGNPTSLDIVIWAYNKTLPPPDDTALAACDYPPNDSCSTSGIACPAGESYAGGLKGVTINAGASILVYLASYYDVTDTFGTSTGAVTLQVKTTDLQ